MSSQLHSGCDGGGGGGEHICGRGEWGGAIGRTGTAAGRNNNDDE